MEQTAYAMDTDGNRAALMRAVVSHVYYVALHTHGPLHAIPLY